MTDITHSHSANDRDQDDLTPMQEYGIAGLVILLFAALYWFFNHGMEGQSVPDTFTGTSPAPLITTAQTHPGQAVQTPTESTTPPASTPSDSLTQTAGKEKTAKVDFQTPPTPTQADHTTPAEPAKAPLDEPQHKATLKAAEQAILQAQAQMRAARQSNPATPPAPGQTKLSDLATREEALAVTQTRADLSVYTLPNGKKIRIAAQGFEHELRNAILKGEYNLPLTFDNIYFESGSAHIASKKSRHQIQATAALLHTYPDVRVLIRGHSDNTGSAAENTRLSLERANAMGLALGKLGIDLQRIRVLGVGDREPVASNDTEAGRSQNRRIDIILVK